MTSGSRLLLVDDHADSVELLRVLLVRRGFAVTVAGSVAAAVAAASAERFDVLVSDMALPDGSGCDILQQLRARGVAVPAVALSGLAREADVQYSLDAGFSEHLAKPVRVEELVAAVRRASGAEGGGAPG